MNARLGVVLLTVVAAGGSIIAMRDRPSVSAQDALDQGVDCAPQTVVPIGEDFFTDVSESSGIQRDNFVPHPDPAIPNNDHSRLAFVDLNADGRDDVVMHNMTGAIATKPFEHLIFLNRGDGTFRNFSDESGLRHSQSAFFTFGDVDSDGDQDCFAGIDGEGDGGTRGANHLYLNDGTGRFTVRPNSGVERIPLMPTIASSAVFADFDGDAKLDLYVGQGGTGYAVADQLFMGNGDGTFTNRTSQLRPTIERPSNGTVACDYDNDHDLDIFVSVYGVSWQHGHDILWENDGKGHFTNVARERGFEAQETGNYFIADTGFGRSPEGVSPDAVVGGNGFGLSCEDINNDGYVDIWQANISHPGGDYNRTWSDPSLLLINQGPEAGYSFHNVYLDVGIPYNEGDLEGGIADFDNDGRPDLSVTRESKYESRPEFVSDEQRGWFGLMHQIHRDWTVTPGAPRGMELAFESVGMRSGVNDPTDAAAMPRMKGGHSNVWSDFDGDGDLDILVGGLHQAADGRPNFLFENEAGARNAWVSFRVDGAGGAFHRDAIGTRIELDYEDRTLVRELRSSRGMYSSSDTRVLHFGLGDLGCPNTMRVTWPDGSTDEFDGATLGQNRQWVVTGAGDLITPTPTPDGGATREPTPSPTENPIRTAYLPQIQR